MLSCFGVAVSHVTKKRSIELPDLRVRGRRAKYKGPSFVRVQEVVSTHLRAELEPLLQRAASVCYVSNTIRAVDDIEVVLSER